MPNEKDTRGVSVKTRMSGIELLKILAIFLIVISHTVPYFNPSSVGYLDLTLSSANAQRVTVAFFMQFGQIGNCIFIICSSYFLLDSKSVKLKKVFYIIFDTTVISVIYLAFFLGFGYKLTAFEIVQAIFPLLFPSKTNWYVFCYLLFYLAHPLLNLIVHALDQRKLTAACAVMFAVYFVLDFFMDQFSFSNIIGFICIYFFVAALKLYPHDRYNRTKFNLSVIFISLAGLIALHVTVNMLGLKYASFNRNLLYFRVLNNPFNYFISFGLFNLFRKLKFQMRGINYISSLSLLIYLIHENFLVRNYIRPAYFDFVYTTFSYDHLVLWVLVGAGATLIIATVFSMIYKATVSRAVEKCIGKLIVVYERKKTCGQAKSLTP